MSDETETYERFEYGYRLEDGRENWELDYGPDGHWIGANRDPKISHVDMYTGREVAAISRALADASVRGVILRRRVVETWYPSEIVEGQEQESTNSSTKGKS